MKRIERSLTFLYISIVLFLLPFNTGECSEDSIFYNSSLKPFYHGVASGDPLTDRVIIWTRVTPNQNRKVNVNWMISKDIFFKNIIKSGKVIASKDKDYTVKVDVIGAVVEDSLLAPNTEVIGAIAVGSELLAPNIEVIGAIGDV